MISQVSEKKSPILPQKEFSRGKPTNKQIWKLSDVNVWPKDWGWFSHGQKGH